MLEQLKENIRQIKERNARVEADKAWETSWFRTVMVAALTYLMMLLLMNVLGVDEPALSALVPTLGFLLSTLSMGFAKKLWLRFFYKP